MIRCQVVLRDLQILYGNINTRSDVEIIFVVYTFLASKERKNKLLRSCVATSTSSNIVKIETNCLF